MADYVTTEPAFDFERGDFVIINGRPKMVVGMDRLRSWIGKVLLLGFAAIHFNAVCPSTILSD